MLVARGTPTQVVYSIGEFLSLPLYQRIQLVLQGKLSFYLGEEEVQTSDALRWLRESATTR